MSTTHGDGRYLAGLRTIHDGRIGRDEYAVLLGKQLDHRDRQDRVSIKAADVNVAAELLDELAAVYRGEPLGQLAREVAVKFYDRLGI